MLYYIGSSLIESWIFKATVICQIRGDLGSMLHVHTEHLPGGCVAPPWVALSLGARGGHSYNATLLGWGGSSQSEHAMNKKLEEKRNKERLSKIVKLPENKKCFDCAGRGSTQYVVMPLWTFVCTGCLGVHREFSH